MTSASDVLQMIKDNDVKFVDLRLTDTLGKEMHVTVPADCIDEDVFELGQPFDGSSFIGWRGIEASDMLLMPDPDSARMDPFREVNTLILQCNVHEPKTGKDYDRDPRSLGLRAEAYLKSTGIGDTAYFGPEPEFFIFDSVRWEHRMGKSFFEIDSEEGPWATGLKTEGGNLGYHNRVKGGYFPVSPVDSFADMRSEMCTLLEQQGVDVEIHHHEVGGAGQCEIGTRFNTLVKRADWTQILKYTVHNVAAAYGKTATFMPAYSSCNRSASIRIPHVNSPKARRVEVRFPDPTANPYLAFSALLMAGLDGIQNKIHPGEAADKNLYDLPPEENAKIPTVCSSLDQALEYLDRDREFLTRGGVFSNDFIDAYIAVKMEEVNRWRLAVTPIEFDMYYSL